MLFTKLTSALAIATSLVIAPASRSQVVETGRSVPVQTETTVTTGASNTGLVSQVTPDGFMIPLPFGSDTQWAKNLFAAGGASLRWHGREYAIVEPRIVDREAAGAHLPLLLRFVAGWLGLREYVMVRRVAN